MIVGLFLNNYKCYKKLNFIPLSYGEKFCGLVGKNGVGKSAVLEALDCVINEKDSWNVHYSCKKDGKRSKSQIVLLFLLLQNEFQNNDEIKQMMEKHSQSIWNLDETSTNDLKNSKCFFSLKNDLKEKSSKYYLISIGMERDFSGKIKLSSGIVKKEPDVDLEKIWTEIKSKYEYIYIPKDIDPSKMTLLQTDELQTALGQTLEGVISNFLEKEKIKNISKELKKFTNDISNKLDSYEFKESYRDRQSNLKSEPIYKLIIKDFFSNRRLNKIIGNNSIDIGNLSSGEKQQAIIELYSKVIKELRQSDKKLILGIDEPESSLHISACFDQFERLYELSGKNVQIIYTAHWYGFIPTLKKGAISNIVYDNEFQDHTFALLRIKDYLEKGATINSVEFELKSMNDFVQSIVASVTTENAYSWLICEGSSDKIYLEHYLKDLVSKKKLRIVAIRGVTAEKFVYELLKAVYSGPHASENVKGKIVILADTDEKFILKGVQIDSRIKFLHFKRLCANDNDIKLVNVDQIDTGEADIESAVNGIAMFQTLKQSNLENVHDLVFLDAEDISDQCVKFARDWTNSEWKKYKSFFKAEGVKVQIAKEYVKLLKNKEIEVSTPSWISDLSKLY